MLLFEESLWHDLFHSFSHKCPNHSAPLASPPHFQSSIPPEPLFSGSLRIVLKFFVLGIISVSESDLCWSPPKRSQAVLGQSGKCAPVGFSGTPSAPRDWEKNGSLMMSLQFLLEWKEMAYLQAQLWHWLGRTPCSHSLLFSIHTRFNYLHFPVTTTFN